MAALLAIALLPNPAQAQIPVQMELSSEPKISKNVIADLKTMPAVFGSIQEIYQGGTKQPVILIQDLHAEPDFQKSIHQMMDYLIQDLGIRQVVVEGGVREFDFRFLHALPDKNALSEIISEHEALGELSGGIASEILRDSQAKYFGAENEKLFIEQTQAFLDAKNRTLEIQKKLNQLSAHLEEEKKKTYSPELGLAETFLEWDQTKPFNFKSAIEFFTQYAKSESYPLVHALAEALEVEKRSAQLLDAIKQFSHEQKLVADPKTQKEIAGLNQMLDTQRIAPFDYLAEVVRLTGTMPGEKLSAELQTHQKVKQIKSAAFLREWEDYTQKAINKLLITSGAKRVFHESQTLRILSRFADLKLRPDEWSKLNQDFPKAYADLPWAHHAKFYELAVLRDREFLKVLNRNEYSEEPVIFLAGGFHTSGLVENFKKQKRSFVVLTPSGQISKSNHRYDELMRGNVSWKASLDLSKDSIDFNQAFLDSIIAKVLKRVEQKEGPREKIRFLKRWQNELIRELAKKKKLALAPDYNKLFRRQYERELSTDYGKEIRQNWARRVIDFAGHLQKGQLVATTSPLFDKPGSEHRLPKSLWLRMQSIDSTGEVEGRRLKVEDRPSNPFKRSEARTSDAANDLDAQIAAFKDNGIPSGVGAADFWASASSEFKRRVIFDLSQVITNIRRKEVQEKRGGLFTPQFTIKPHQLRDEDFREDVYPGRSLGSLQRYYQSPWEASGQKDQITLTNFILNDLGFSASDIPPERIWEWTAYPDPSGSHWMNPKKIEKLIELLDFLAGNPDTGTPGREWNENTMTFQETESPRTLSALMEDDLQRYFRSRWIVTQGNSADYSRFGVYHELGFTTGNLMGQVYDDFFKLVEMASVIRAMKKYPAYFDSKPDPQLLQDLIEKAHALIYTEGEMDKLDPNFRERHIITHFDLSKRVYERIFLNNLKQIHYWQGLIIKAYDEMEKEEIAQAVEGLSLGKNEKIINDDDGQPALKVKINPKTNKVEAISTYGEISQGTMGFRAHKVIEDIVFDEQWSIADWQSHMGDVSSAPYEKPSRSEKEESLLFPKSDWTLFIKNPKKEKKKTTGGTITGIAQITDLAGDAYYLDEYQFNEGQSADYDPEMTLEFINEYVGGIQSRSFYSEDLIRFQILLDPATKKVMGYREYHYSTEHKLSHIEEWSIEDGFNFDESYSADDWKSIRREVIKRTYYDGEEEKGRELLVLDFAVGSKANKVNQITSYDGKDKKRKSIQYGAFALAQIQNKWNGQEWLLENWMENLSAYQAFYSSEVDTNEQKVKIESVRKEFKEKRDLITKASKVYRQYQNGERISEPFEFAQEIENFIENKLQPALRVFADEEELQRLDLSDRMIHTVSLASQNGVAAIAKLTEDEENALLEVLSLLDPVDSKKVTAEDAKLIANVFKDPKVDSKMLPAIGETGLRASIKRVQAIEKKLKTVEEIYIRVLLDMRATLVDYRKGRSNGDFAATLHANKTSGWQAALWLAEHLHEDYPGLHRFLDDDSLSLIYAAHRAKGFKTHQESQADPDSIERKILPDITDVQTDEILSQTMQTSFKPDLWNQQREESNLKMLSQDAAYQGLYDVVTSIFRLQTLSPQEVAAKFVAVNQVLHQDGVFAVVLPANKMFDDETLKRLQEDYGLEIYEKGMAHNELEDGFRNQLLASNGESDEVTLFAEEAIRRRHFHVFVFQKTGSVTQRVIENLDTQEIKIVNAKINLDDIDTGIVTRQERDQRVRADAKRTAQDLLYDGIHGDSLRASPLIEVEAPSAEEQQARSVQIYNRRQRDMDEYRFHQERLRLIHKYRHFLLDGTVNPLAMKSSTDRERVAQLLETTFSDTSDKAPKNKAEKPLNYWQSKRTVWNPKPANLSTHDVWDASGKNGFTIFVDENNHVARLVMHRTDLKGQMYSAVLKLKIEGEKFQKAKDYDFWTTQLGRLYENEVDYKEQKKFYKQVDAAYALLEKSYPLLEREPGFDFWFEDDLGRSLEALIKTDQYAELIKDLFTYRDFILGVYKKWRDHSSPVSIEEGQQIAAMRQYVRDMHNVFQLFGGPTFSRGHRRGEMTADKHWLSEASRHSMFLEGIVSFMSAMSGAKREEALRQLAEGVFMSGDLAAGSGAKAWARHRLNLPPPTDDFRYRELDASPEYLKQPRPPEYKKDSQIVDDEKQPFLQTLGLIEQTGQHYSENAFDFLSAFFIVDFLTPEQVKQMFIEANKVLKTGGEFYLTLPQSWQLPASFIEALTLMGYEVTTPMRGYQKMTDAWVEKIENHYGDSSYGKEIAAEAKRMREKQFTILRLKKKVTINPQDPLIKDMEASVFDLLKTDTGQRGKTDGSKPFKYDPQAMRRWMEILKWVLKDWRPEDVEVFDPFEEKKDQEGKALLTREQVLEIFPEIESENALKHLYDFRFLFRTEQSGLMYELISNFQVYWDSKSEYFHAGDVEMLRKIYKGLAVGDYATLLSWGDVARRLKQSSDFFAALMAKGAYRDRNDALRQQALQLQKQLWDASEDMKRAHPLAYLAIPVDRYQGEDLSHPIGKDEFSILRRSDESKPELSIQLLAGLLTFQHHRKPGDDAAFAILDKPAEKFVDLANRVAATAEEILNVETVTSTSKQESDMYSAEPPAVSRPKFSYWQISPEEESWIAEKVRQYFGSSQGQRKPIADEIRQYIESGRDLKHQISRRLRGLDEVYKQIFHVGFSDTYDYENVVSFLVKQIGVVAASKMTQEQALVFLKVNQERMNDPDLDYQQRLFSAGQMYSSYVRIRAQFNLFGIDGVSLGPDFQYFEVPADLQVTGDINRRMNELQQQFLAISNDELKSRQFLERLGTSKNDRLLLSTRLASLLKRGEILTATQNNFLAKYFELPTSFEELLRISLSFKDKSDRQGQDPLLGMLPMLKGPYQKYLELPAMLTWLRSVSVNNINYRMLFRTILPELWKIMPIQQPDLISVVIREHPSIADDLLLVRSPEIWSSHDAVLEQKKQFAEQLLSEFGFEADQYYEAAVYFSEATWLVDFGRDLFRKAIDGYRNGEKINSLKFINYKKFEALLLLLDAATDPFKDPTKSINLKIGPRSIFEEVLAEGDNRAIYEQMKAEAAKSDSSKPASGAPVALDNIVKPGQNAKRRYYAIIDKTVRDMSGLEKPKGIARPVSEYLKTGLPEKNEVIESHLRRSRRDLSDSDVQEVLKQADNFRFYQSLEHAFTSLGQLVQHRLQDAEGASWFRHDAMIHTTDEKYLFFDFLSFSKKDNQLQGSHLYMTGPNGDPSWPFDSSNLKPHVEKLAEEYRALKQGKAVLKQEQLLNHSKLKLYFLDPKAKQHLRDDLISGDLEILNLSEDIQKLPERNEEEINFKRFAEKLLKFLEDTHRKGWNLNGRDLSARIEQLAGLNIMLTHLRVWSMMNGQINIKGSAKAAQKLKAKIKGEFVSLIANILLLVEEAVEFSEKIIAIKDRYRAISLEMQNFLKSFSEGQQIFRSFSVFAGRSQSTVMNMSTNQVGSVDNFTLPIHEIKRPDLRSEARAKGRPLFDGGSNEPSKPSNSVKQETPAEKEARLDGYQKILDSNWREYFTAIKNAPDEEPFTTLRVKLLAASLQYASMFEELKADGRIQPELYDQAVRFLAELNELTSETLLLKLHPPKPKVTQPVVATPAVSPYTKENTAHPANSPQDMAIRATVMANDPSWQWHNMGEDGPAKDRVENIILRRFVREYLDSDLSQHQELQEKITKYALANSDRTAAIFMKLSIFKDSELSFSDHSYVNIKSWNTFMGSAITQWVEVRNEFQETQIALQGAKDIQLSFHERLKLQEIAAHDYQIRLSRFGKSLLTATDKMRQTLNNSHIQWFAPPSPFVSPEIHKTTTLKLQNNSKLEGSTLEAQRERQIMYYKLASKIIGRDPVIGNETDADLLRDLFKYVHTIDDFYSLLVVGVDSRAEFPFSFFQVYREVFLKKLNELLSDPEQLESFYSLMKSHYALGLFYSLFIAITSQPNQFMEILSTYPEIRKAVISGANYPDPRVSQSINLLLGRYAADTAKVRGEALRKASQTLHEVLKSGLDQYENADYVVPSHLLMPEAGTAIIVVGILINVMNERIKEGLEQKSFARVSMQKYFNILKQLAPGINLGENDFELLLEWRMENGRPVHKFDRAVDEYPNGRQIYNEILAAEKAKLATPEFQRDFYDLVAATSKEYEQFILDERKVKGPLADRPLIPDSLEDLIPFLRSSRVFETYPELAGHDLSKGSLLYEALELAFQRHQYEYELANMYRVAAQTMLGMDSQASMSHLRFNVLLTLPHPNGKDIQRVRADAVEVDGAGSVTKVYFFPLGKLQKSSDNTAVFEHATEKMGLVINSQRIAALTQNTKMNQPEFYIVYPEADENNIDVSILPVAIRPNIKSIVLDDRGTKTLANILEMKSKYIGTDAATLAQKTRAFQIMAIIFRFLLIGMRYKSQAPQFAIEIKNVTNEAQSLVVSGKLDEAVQKLNRLRTAIVETLGPYKALEGSPHYAELSRENVQLENQRDFVWTTPNDAMNDFSSNQTAHLLDEQLLISADLGVFYVNLLHDVDMSNLSSHEHERLNLFYEKIKAAQNEDEVGYWIEQLNRYIAPSVARQAYALGGLISNLANSNLSLQAAWQIGRGIKLIRTPALSGIGYDDKPIQIMEQRLSNIDTPDAFKLREFIKRQSRYLRSTEQTLASGQLEDIPEKNYIHPDLARYDLGLLAKIIREGKSDAQTVTSEWIFGDSEKIAERFLKTTTYLAAIGVQDRSMLEAHRDKILEWFQKLNDEFLTTQESRESFFKEYTETPFYKLPFSYVAAMTDFSNRYPNLVRMLIEQINSSDLRVISGDWSMIAMYWQKHSIASTEEKRGIINLFSQVMAEHFKVHGFDPGYAMVLIEEFSRLPSGADALVKAAQTYFEEKIHSAEAIDEKPFVNVIRQAIVLNFSAQPSGTLADAEKEIHRVLQVDDRGRNLFEQIRYKKEQAKKIEGERKLYHFVQSNIRNFERQHFRFPTLDEFNQWFNAEKNEHMQLQYTRARWKRALENAYKAFAKYALIDRSGSDKKSFQDFLLPVNAPGAERTVNLIPDHMVFEREWRATDGPKSPVEDVVWFELGWRMPFEDESLTRIDAQTNVYGANFSQMKIHKPLGINFENATQHIRYLNPNFLPEQLHGENTFSVTESHYGVRVKTDFGSFVLATDQKDFQGAMNYLQQLISRNQLEDFEDIKQMEHEIESLETIERLSRYSQMQLYVSRFSVLQNQPEKLRVISEGSRAMYQDVVSKLLGSASDRKAALRGMDSLEAKVLRASEAARLAPGSDSHVKVTTYAGVFTDDKKVYQDLAAHRIVPDTPEEADRIFKGAGDRREEVRVTQSTAILAASVMQGLKPRFSQSQDRQSTASLLKGIANRILSEPAYAAELYAQDVANPYDPRSINIFDDMNQNLSKAGLIFDDREVSNLVMLRDSLPDAETIISMMRAEKAASLALVIKSIKGMDGQEKIFEDEVNLAIGSAAGKKRFHLLVAGKEHQVTKTLKEAANVLATSYGRGSLASVSDSLVYIVSEADQVFVPVHRGKVLRHKITEADEQLFGKEYLLLKSAAEISRKHLSELLGRFVEEVQKGESYFFNDGEIPSDLLNHFLQAINEIHQAFAASA